MSWMRNPGRVAGFLYLLVDVIAPFSLIYIPSTMIVRGNAAATVNNIGAHETLFRLGIISDLLSTTLFVLVVLALYRILKDVDRNLAVLMVILGGIMTPTIGFVTVVNNGAALLIMHGGDFLAAFDHSQRDALAMLFLRLNHPATLSVEVLWGLWLFPLAILIYRSRFLPRFLGIWLIINGLAYVAESVIGWVTPQYDNILSTILTPAQLGEVALTLWLLIMGADPQPRREVAD